MAGRIYGAHGALGMFQFGYYIFLHKRSKPLVHGELSQLFSLFLPLEFLLDESVKFHYKKPGAILKGILMAAILAALILQMTGSVMFIKSTRFFQVLLPVSIFFYTGMVMFEAVWDKNNAGALWSTPMLILTASCIMELVYYVRNVVYASSRYFLIGTMIFCFFMCMIGGVQIRKSIETSRRERAGISALADEPGDRRAEEVPGHPSGA